LLGRYNPTGQPDENVYIASFSGDRVDSDRIGRKGAHLEAPCVSLLWLPQPDLMNRLLSNTRLRDGGFLQRLLICDTKLDPREIPKYCSAIPAKVRENYNNLISTLISTYRESPLPMQIPADPAALEIIRCFRNELVTRRRTGGDLADFSTYAARWHEQGLRIAGLNHCAWHSGQAHQLNLTAEHALAIVKWFSQNQLALFVSSRHAAHRSRLDDLIKLLREKGAITFRDLERRHCFGASELKELCEMFPAKIQSFETKDPKGGRPSFKVRLRK
jgi:hypothetical protein